MARRKILRRIQDKYESSLITKEELRKLLEKGVVGRVTGVIGPFVIRYHNGKQIISERPKNFRMSMNSAAVQGRNNFAASVKFAGFLYKNEILREIWSKADIEGRRAWNRVQKYNHIYGTHPTQKNVITPGKCHFEISQGCTLEKDFSIRVKEELAENKMPIIIMVYYDPVKRSGQAFEMIYVNDSKLSEDQIEICKHYRKYILYSALFWKNGDKIEWSNTMVSEGIFNENNVVTRDYSEALLILLYLVVSVRYTRVNPFRWKLGYP